MCNQVVRNVLSGCPHISELRLDGCWRLTDAAFDVSGNPFQTLLGVLTLKTLSLQECPQITGNITTTLNKHSRDLRCLNLSQCKNVESSAIREIFEHGALRSLNLAFIDEIGDEVFMHFPIPTDNLLHLEIVNSYTTTATTIASATATSMNANSDRTVSGSASDASRIKTLPDYDISTTNTAFTMQNKRQSHRQSPLQQLHLGKTKITDASLLRTDFFGRLVEIHLQWYCRLPNLVLARTNETSLTFLS